MRKSSPNWRFARGLTAILFGELKTGWGIRSLVGGLGVFSLLALIRGPISLHFSPVATCFLDATSENIEEL